MLCKCEQGSSSLCVSHVFTCVFCSQRGAVYACKQAGVFKYVMPIVCVCVLSVHVQLIKELLRDGSHPVTSKLQESFTYQDSGLNSATLSEQEQDDIADKDRRDMDV